MKWLTQEQIKEASHGDDTALDCAIEHWRQISCSTPGSLQRAHLNLLVDDSTDYCCLCMRYSSCSDCPMNTGLTCNDAGSIYANLRRNPDWLNLNSIKYYQVRAKKVYDFLKGLR